MTGQKDAVIALVEKSLPNFNKYKDIALVMLSAAQLEQLKQDIGAQIMSGLVEYSKDKSNRAEVTTYARSMVMNHLKKAKELNGNVIYGGGVATPAKEPKNHFPLTKSELTPELASYLETL